MTVLVPAVPRRLALRARAAAARGLVLVTCLVLAAALSACGSSVPTRGSGASAPGSRELMPRGDLPGWHQVLAEDFGEPVALGQFPGPHYAPAWRGYDGLSDTSGHGRYSPARVLSVHSGYLDVFLHSANGVPLVAAPFPHLPSYGQRYGRYSVRFRADAVRGYKLAFLLWPDDETWAHGEVDYPEGSLDGRFYAASRRANRPGPPTFDGTGPLATFSGWHTATTQWTAGHVSWFLDGRPVGTATVQTPTVPMHWVLQVETATDGTRPSPAASGHVQVDWVVAYTPAARK